MVGDSNLELLATIDRLMALDRERVIKIEELTTAQKMFGNTKQRLLTTIDRLMALDHERVTKIEELTNTIKTFTDNIADEMLIRSRNLSFLEEPNFAEAWKISHEHNLEGWPAGVPDVRWRARIALWAAERGLALEGDFVECGVHTGLLSLTICHALKFEKLARNFYLFDTFNGIPLASLSGSELEKSGHSNENYYQDVYEVAKRNFAPFPNAHLIRGELPGSLGLAPIQKIAYLSMDLNTAVAEHKTIEQLWGKIVPGAMILIDDYLWIGCEAQYEMWNGFAKSKNVTIAPLPTGQGLIIKPHNAF